MLRVRDLITIKMLMYHSMGDVLEVHGGVIMTSYADGVIHGSNEVWCVSMHVSSVLYANNADQLGWC